MSINLPSVLTFGQAKAEVTRLERAVAAQPGTAVVLDAGPLNQLDSSAIAVLLQCRRTAQASGGVLKLINRPVQLQSLLDLYGVSELFPA